MYNKKKKMEIYSFYEHAWKKYVKHRALPVDHSSLLWALLAETRNLDMNVKQLSEWDSKRNEWNFMKAYKTYLTIQDPKHVVLPAVSFHPGQRIEVILLAVEDGKSTQSTYIRELESLLKATQELPQAQSITEEDIAAEVKAYRCS